MTGNCTFALAQRNAATQTSGVNIGPSLDGRSPNENSPDHRPGLFSFSGHGNDREHNTVPQYGVKFMPPLTVKVPLPPTT